MAIVLLAVTAPASIATYTAQLWYAKGAQVVRVAGGLVSRRRTQTGGVVHRWAGRKGGMSKGADHSLREAPGHSAWGL